MRKAQAVRRATWAGAGALLGAAALARRNRAAAAGVLAAAAALGVAAFHPRNPALGRTLSRGPSGRPRAALTFDDGPGPSTPDVLDALAREGVRGTFFVLGRQAERHPETVRRIAAEGHQVANHGYDHGILIFRGPAHVRDQLARCETAVAAAAGPDAMTPLFRAPHGFRGTRDRPRRPPRRLPDGGVDPGGLRLGRAGRRGDRPPGHPRARAGHDPAAPRRRRVGARSGRASRRPTRSRTSAGRARARDLELVTLDELVAPA